MKVSLAQGESLARTYVLSAPITAEQMEHAATGATPGERRERLLAVVALLRFNRWAKSVFLSIEYDDEEPSRTVRVTIAATRSTACRLARYFDLEESAAST